jgi:DNA-binding Lrp family transcriptional regulator
MLCEEKARLLAEYETTTKDFAASITDLQRKIGTSPKTEYDRLQRATDEARLKSEQARLALERHVAAHGC